VSDQLLDVLEYALYQLARRRRVIERDVVGDRV